MKKIILGLIIFSMTAGFAYGVSAPTEDDYRNLDELRAKMVRLRREMDKFMREVIGTYPDQGGVAVQSFGQEVRVDISETDKDVIVKADMPGMEKDKIDITLQNNRILKIAGNREVEKKEAAPGVVKQERMSGKFERVLELPVECKSEGIAATYKAGVLEITIPKMKKTEEKPVKINIQ